MTDITIPPEALEAAIAAAIDAEPNIRDQLHAACLAMLKAWPGAVTFTPHAAQWPFDAASVILPLPTEKLG